MSAAYAGRVEAVAAPQHAIVCDNLVRIYQTGAVGTDFILDLDMFSSAPMPFAVDRVVAEAQRYAERIYTIFRWAVTKDFLVRYGAKL